LGHENAKLPVEDLEFLVNKIDALQGSYREAQVLIYGGTGFVGTWLTSALIYADQELDLRLKLIVVTRNRLIAEKKFAWKKNSSLEFIQHDFSVTELSQDVKADFIFHGATPTRASTGAQETDEVITSSINAAKHAIRTQSEKFSKPRVLHLSSGIVFGIQPQEMSHRNENDIATNGNSPYACAKIEVEKILRASYERGEIFYQSPRLFAFAGPLIQLDAHFAIGNFLRDGLGREPIKVHGNPSTMRSFMYPTDLVNALLNIATVDKYQNFNIGSEEAISMRELANEISQLTSQSRVVYTNPTAPVSNYVPSIFNLKELMPNLQLLDLHTSIQKWVQWMNEK
jgi:dTDP-glucose 4,6-dehydratase